MKTFLFTFLFMAGFILLLFLTWHGRSFVDFRLLSDYETNNSLRDLAESMQLVGLFGFFIGLILVTGSAEMFMAIGYTMKSVFRRHRQKYDGETYYDYVQRKKTPKRFTTFSVSVFLLGIAFFGIAYYLVESLGL